MATIALLVLLVPMARQRPMLMAAAASGVTAILLRGMPLRLGLMLAVIMITGSGLSALFSSDMASPYWAALGVLAMAAGLLLTRQLFDVFGLSAVALGINTLLVCGLASRLFDRGHDEIAGMLMLGLAAAVLLALTVQGILWRTRREAP